MKLSLLLLLAVVVVCCRANFKEDSLEEKDLTGPDGLNERVTREVYTLIEAAVKLGQYEGPAEKMKAARWVQNRLDNINELLDNAKDPKIPTTAEAPPEVTFPVDCLALLEEGFGDSGLYNIYPSYPESTDPLQVHCDQSKESDGGGWIVFQRRTDGSGRFNRSWDEYRRGFGELTNEFWLGNDNLVLLTGGNAELRVDIRDWADGTAFAQYDTFTVRGARYTLTVDGYIESSTAGNPLEYHNGMDFTTRDNDNDRASGGNCAVWMQGGWWFNYCLLADPNGPYLLPVGPHGALSPGQDQGVTWTSYDAHGYQGRHYSLKGTEMKLRRAPASYP